MFYIYEKKNKHFIWSLLISILFLVSSVVSLIIWMENKKKKEEKDLDEYLESSIQ